MNTPEPKRPRTNYYDGRAYFSLVAGKSNKDVAVEAWQKDWIRWARQEIKRLREEASV